LTRTRLLIPLFALLAALFLAACGDDGGGGDNGEDPQEVLSRTFNNAQEVDSGTFDVSIKLNAEGDQGGDVETSIGGAFQSKDGEVPAFDVDGELKADTPIQDFDFSGGLISTGQSAFVSYQDKNYQVPQEAFDTFAQRFIQLQQKSADQKDQGNFLKSLGIDPTNWATNLENEGTDDVEGDETIHISGDADVPKLVEDLKTLAEKSPTPTQIDPSQLDALTDAVQKASFDVYSGTDDDILRRIDASLEIEAPEGTPGASGKVTVDFSLSLGAINEPQTIESPEGAEPLQNLLQQFGLDESSIEDALGGSGLPQAGGAPAAPDAGSTDAYLQCLQNAQGAAETQACAELL
jgi:hypothetical protein